MFVHLYTVLIHSFSSSGYIPRNGMAEYTVLLHLIFSWTARLLSKAAKSEGSNFSITFINTYFNFKKKIIVILLGMQWYLTVGLTCISLVTMLSIFSSVFWALHYLLWRMSTQISVYSKSDSAVTLSTTLESGLKSWPKPHGFENLTKAKK